MLGKIFKRKRWHHYFVYRGKEGVVTVKATTNKKINTFRQLKMVENVICKNKEDKQNIILVDYMLNGRY